MAKRSRKPEETDQPLGAESQAQAETRKPKHRAKVKPEPITLTPTQDHPEPEIPGAAFEILEEKPAKTSTAKVQRWRSAKAKKEQSTQTALTLLAILDGAIGVALGPECQMTRDDHAMIDEPLARILSRLAPETTEFVEKWTDPILLATGLVMWGARIFFILQRRALEAEAEQKAKPRPTPPTPENIGGNNRADSDMATGVPVEVAEALG